MPFNTLLLSGCLLSGKTSYKEEGVEINLQPSSGETVLFFLIDTQSNPNCNLCNLLGLNKQGMKICDLIVFYAKDNEKIICFVELKGSNIKTAKEQVINTYTHFDQYLRKCGLLDSYTAKAYIKTNSSVPQEINKYQQELREKFGEGNYQISRDPNLGNFIRGARYQPKGKGKGNRNR